MLTSDKSRLEKERKEHRRGSKKIESHYQCESDFDTLSLSLCCVALTPALPAFGTALVR